MRRTKRQCWWKDCTRRLHDRSTNQARRYCSESHKQKAYRLRRGRR